MSKHLLKSVCFIVCFLFGLQAFAAVETLSSGSYIINMGVVPQTTANGLKPYGLIYDLLKNDQVPVKWVISQTKVKDGVDFVYNGVSYKGGTFIIPAEYRTASVNAKIVSYGVTGTTTTSALSVDVTMTLNSAPRWTLDAAKGSIAQPYFAAAGIPTSAYNWKLPTELGPCDDIFVLPHADPTWSTHGNLYNFVTTNKGSVWASCHAVSMLENMNNGTLQTNFLALNVGAIGNALVPYASHSQGSIPFTHQEPSAYPAQYMGTTDAAQLNGSEQIYLPKLGGGWRPTTKIIAYDPTQANVPSLSPGPAAVIAYGRAYGNTAYGTVMYEGGHSISGTSTAAIAAQRAFFDFGFAAAKDKTPEVTASSAPAGLNSSTTGLFSVTASSPVGSTISYQWSSSCGGSFSSATSASTNFTAPVVSSNTNCIVSCVMTDACGRKIFSSYSVVIYPGSRPPVAVNDSKTSACLLDSITVNVLTNDSDPDGDPITFAGFTPASGLTTGGTFYHRGNGNVTFIPVLGFTGSQAITYSISDGTSTSSATLTITSGNPSNAPTAVADTIQTSKNIIRLRKNVKANDTDPMGISSSIVSVVTNPLKGTVSVNLDGTIDYMPKLDSTGADSFSYEIMNADRLVSIAKVRVNVSAGVCGAGQYQVAAAGAAVVDSSLTNNGDTYISEKTAEAGQNNGTCTTLLVDGQGTGKIYRSLLQFATSGIPSGATVDSAKLILNCSAAVSGTGDVGVYKMLTSWTEGSQCNATGTPNWTTLGGASNFDTTTLAVRTVAAAGSYSWNVKSQVQRWVSKLDSNYGFLLKFPTEGGTNQLKTFDSKESTTAANRPKLVVSYTPAPTCSTVAARPPFANPDFATTVNGVAVNISTAGNDVDVAGTKTYSIVTAPASGTATIDASTGVITYTPNTTYNGVRTITYRVVNGTTTLADTAIAYCTINNAPIDAVNDNVTPGDSSGVAQTINVMTNDTDLEFAAVSNANGHSVSIYTAPKNGTATVNASGNIVYTPATGFSGKDTLIYQVCEPNPSCGFPACDTARLFLTVLNKKPIAVSDTLNMAVCAPKTINLFANDSDPENTSLSLTSLSTISPSAAADSVVNNGDGTITFYPAAGYTGTATIKYTISDNGTPVRSSDTAILTINVQALPNNKPVAVDDYTDTLSLGASDVYSVTDNDSDPDGNLLDIPSIIKSPSHGTATLLANGLITYQAPYNYIGKDTITYRINDIVNTIACVSGVGLYDTAYVFLNISAPNSVYATNDENSTRANEDAVGTVVRNDFDPQTDSIVFKGFINTSGTAVLSGSITVSGYTKTGTYVANVGTLAFTSSGSYTYTPDTTFEGTMIVPYAIADNRSAKDTAQLRITVSPSNTAATTLIAQNDENRSYGGAITSSVTANDFDPAGHSFSVSAFNYDSNGDGTADASGTLASSTTIAGIDIFGNPVSNAGTFVLNASGTYTFTPAADFYGQVIIPYTVTCTGSVSTSANLTIDVLPDANGPANDPPFAGDDFKMTKVGVPVSGSFIANDLDPNGDALSYGGTTLVPGGPKTAIGSPVTTLHGGTVQFYADGTYTYTPSAFYTGPDAVSYTICDVTAQPLCADAFIHFVVDNPSSVLAPPVAQNIAAPAISNTAAATSIPSLQASSPIKVPLDSFFVLTIPNTSTEGTLYYCATPGAGCTKSVVTAGMKLTYAQSRSLFFDPLASFVGTATFTYEVKDTNALVSNVATYSLPVTNDPPITVNISTAPLVDTTSMIQIPELVAGDKDGTISSYTISNVPLSGAKIYYCSSLDSPCTTSVQISSTTTLTPAQMKTLAVVPDSGFSGNYSFNYTATDNNGNVSNLSTYTIPVIAFSAVPGNLPPTAVNITAQPIPNNAGQTPIPNLAGVDPENGAAGIDSFIIGSSIPNPLTEGTLYYCVTPGASCALTAVSANMRLTAAQAATLQFDPVASFVGTASFTYQTKDTYSPALYSDAATYQIPVVNVAPVANPVLFSPIAHTLTTPTLLAPLSGSDYDGTVVSYNITTVPASTDGTLQYCASGTYPTCTPTTVTGPVSGLTAAQIATLTFTPNSGFTGVYEFGYTVVDNNNQISAEALYSIPVIGFDVVSGEPPIAYSYSAAPISSTTTLSLSSALSAYDSDGTITSYTITSVPSAVEGSLTYCVTPGPGCTTSAVTVGLSLSPSQAATLSFTPSANFTGTVTFNYMAYDNDSNMSNSATVTIPVVNQNPVSTNIVNPAISLTGGAVALTSLSSSDPDGTIAGYTILSVPSADEGTLSVCTTAPSTGCTPVSAGQVLTSAQVAQLAFTPNTTNNNPTITFLYATTDNSGNYSNVASSTIPVLDAALLPINLLYFTAEKQGRNALLSWRSAREDAGLQYELEHSVNGAVWASVYKRTVSATSVSGNQYSYLHANLPAGKHFYRLRLVAPDATVSFSPVRTLNYDQTMHAAVSIFPNPVSGKAILQTENGMPVEQLSILSADGRTLQEFNRLDSGSLIDLSGYTNGLYLIKVRDNNGETQIIKVSKK